MTLLFMKWNFTAGFGLVIEIEETADIGFNITAVIFAATNGTNWNLWLVLFVIAEVTLVDEAQGRNDDNLMFDTGVFDEQEVKVKKAVSTAEVTTVSATTTTLNADMEEEESLQNKREEYATLQKMGTDQAYDNVIRASWKIIRAQEHEDFTVEENQLKNKIFDEVQKAFDKTMGWIDSFVSMDSEVVKKIKKKLAEMKKHMEIVPDDENIDREDLKTLWKLVKAKHRNTRPEEAYERVLWGDMKVMFEPDVESEVWRNLQGYNVTVWKLFSSSGVHFVRFQNLHIFMLVEKKYPFTPSTIIKMLNKKLQTDHWNKMCYQLFKLMTKQLKNLGSV
ncbi:hypothetical protein Tco_1276580 [Tanacetum coccineum]